MLLLLAAACSGGDDDAAGTAEPESTPSGSEVVDPYDGHRSEVYDGTTNWICHPDLADGECNNLTATELAADGSTQAADLDVAAEPAIDCFYVYPTTSTDPGNLSDRQVDESENATVRAQAAPFASQCRVFAPAYQQITIAGIYSGAFAGDEWETAHSDVVDAWKTYVSQYNDGRGVVLIGHSQGTGHLNGLINDEIVGQSDLQDRLVSAILLGGDTSTFDGIPPCEAGDQVGCFVAYGSYPASQPPTAGSFFGAAQPDGTRLACVDPTELAGDGLADAIVPAEQSLLGGVDLGVDVQTDYVVVPDALDLACESIEGFDYLSVAIAPGQDATRLAGFTNAALGPQWGLHLLDANVAMGELLEIVAAQSDAFAAD